MYIKWSNDKLAGKLYMYNNHYDYSNLHIYIGTLIINSN